MVFVKNKTQQLQLMDSTFNLTERERSFLEKSWAKDFAENIFPRINEEIFAPLYSSNYSRPNTPVTKYNQCISLSGSMVVIAPYNPE